MPLLLAMGSPVGAGDDGGRLLYTGTKMVCNPLEFEGIDYMCQKLNIMVILDKPITREELVRLAENFYGDMIKEAGMWRMRRLEKE